MIDRWPTWKRIAGFGGLCSPPMRRSSSKHIEMCPLIINDPISLTNIHLRMVGDQEKDVCGTDGPVSGEHIRLFNRLVHE